MVTFKEKLNSSFQAPRPKAISHSFWPFLMGPLGLPWNFSPTFCMHLPTGDVRPPEKTGVVFELWSGFGEIVSKIPRKTNFFCIFLNKFSKNYQSLPPIMGHCLGALMLAQGMSQGRKIGLPLERNPSPSPRPQMGQLYTIRDIPIALQNKHKTSSV